jgi:spore germination protein (amino acid permease)
MPTHPNQISIRQLMILFIVSTFSPSIRLFPAYGSKLGERAGWLAPIISSVAMFIIFAVLYSFFKNNNIANLSDIFDLSLGKAAGKALLVFYLVFILLLYFLYIRYYADRLLGTIFPNADIRAFVIPMLLLVYMSARGKLETLARFSEFSILIFIFIFLLFFILLIPTFKISNVIPITQYDILPAAKATYPILGIWGYVTLMFFLGDDVFNKNELKKYSKQVIYFLVILITLMMLFLVGTLGYETIMRMPIPFFNVTKVISAMETFDRLEAILLSVWLISDFVIISIFAIIIKNIGKKLFAASETKYSAAPVVLLGYVGCMFITTNRNEIYKLSNYILLASNIILCFVIPIIVLVIGKVRKKI